VPGVADVARHVSCRMLNLRFLKKMASDDVMSKSRRPYGTDRARGVCYDGIGGSGVRQGRHGAAVGSPVGVAVIASPVSVAVAASPSLATSRNCRRLRWW
jgi:hypothetical protein